VPTKPKKSQKRALISSSPRDLFQTPRYASGIIIPYIPKKVKRIWECAAGGDKISSVLREHDYEVFSTDISESYRSIPNHYRINFLTDYLSPELYFDAIITNPPYSLKKEFYLRCLEYGRPFALLIPADYSQWLIKALWKDGAEKIIPTRRIDFITPKGLSGKSSASQFHSMWLTWGFNLGKSETFVELSIKDKENI
jgi:hypothetical protein